MSDNTKIGLFKLVSGEEIIAMIKDVTTNEYMLDRPRVVGIQQRRPGDPPAIGLMPWILGHVDDNEVILYKSACMGRASTVPKEFEDAYITHVTNITLVS